MTEWSPQTQSKASSGTLVIGITGGMASGKSTVAKMVAEQGFPHLDADQIVHQLMREDADTITAIASAFPASADGKTVDRSVLASTISHHPERLSELEAILHPRVRAAELAFIQQARNNGARAVLLDIPLLFETDAHELCDKIIVTHAALEHRKARAFSRPGMTEEKWERILARQLPDHRTHPRADIIIDTGMSEPETRMAVQDVLKMWGLL